MTPQRFIGFVLAAQWVLTCILKFIEGQPVELAWLCHVTLLLAAMGLILNRPLLIHAALIAVLGPHSLWLMDLTGSVILGYSPFGITGYLEGMPWWVWLGTAHHLYLMPILLWIVLRSDDPPRGAIWLASVLYLYLTVFSHAFLPATDNVNYAHGLFGAIDFGLLNNLNRLPGAPYLLLLNVGTTAVFFAPAGWLILKVRRRLNTPSASSHAV